MTCLLALIEQNHYRIPVDAEMISRFVVIRPQTAHVFTGRQEKLVMLLENAENKFHYIHKGRYPDQTIYTSIDARGKAKSREMLI